RATGERLANIAASAHSAISDDWHVARCFFEVSVARRRAIDCRSDLRNTQSKHTARSASRTWADTDQNRSRPTLHNFESHVITYSVSYNHRNAHLTAKFLQVERLVLRRNVSHRRNRALHDENVRASLLSDLAKFGRSLRNGTNRRQYAAVFNLAYTCRDEIFLNGFLVDSLQQRSDLGFIGFDDFLQHFLRIFVARLHSLEIQNGQTAQFIHGDGEADIDNSVHGAGKDGNFQFERLCFSAR